MEDVKSDSSGGDRDGLAAASEEPHRSTEGRGADTSLLRAQHRDGQTRLSTRRSGDIEAGATSDPAPRSGSGSERLGPATAKRSTASRATRNDAGEAMIVVGPDGKKRRRVKRREKIRNAQIREQRRVIRQQRKERRERRERKSGALAGTAALETDEGEAPTAVVTVDIASPSASQPDEKDATSATEGVDGDVQVERPDGEGAAADVSMDAADAVAIDAEQHASEASAGPSRSIADVLKFRALYKPTKVKNKIYEQGQVEDRVVDDGKFAGRTAAEDELSEGEYYDTDADEDPDLPWIKPSLQKAKRFQRKTFFENGRASLCRTGQEDISKMGAGITLYFAFLKWGSIMFFLWTILYLPTFYFAWRGKGAELINVEPLSLNGMVMKLSLGNARWSDPVPVEFRHDQDLVNVTVDLWGYWTNTFDEKEISWWIQLNDMLCCVVFVLFIIAVRRRMTRVIYQVDQQNVTAADYSVFVRGLPTDATESEIRDHFSNLFQLSDPDWEFDGYCFGACFAKESRLPQDVEDLGDIQDGEYIMPEDPVDPCTPVEDFTNSADPDYQSSWVAEISMAYRDGKAIRSYLSRSQLATKLRNARAAVKKYAPDTPYKGGPNESAVLRAQRTIARIERSTEKQLSRMPQTNDDNCVAAFVIFNNEESFLRCVDDYDGSHSFVWRSMQPQVLKFRQVHALSVVPAPEPSNVLWEHLDTPYLEVVARRAVTALVTVALLVLTFVIVFVSRTGQTALAGTVPTDAVCREHVGAAIYGEYLDAVNPLLVRDTTVNICPSTELAFLRYDVDFNSSRYTADELSEAGVELVERGFTSDDGLFHWRGSEFEPSHCNNPCVDPNDERICSPLACQPGQEAWSNLGHVCTDDVVNMTANAAFKCYCSQRIVETLTSGVDGVFTVWAEVGDFCRSYAVRYALSFALPLLAPLVVVVTNLLLKKVISSLARFEHHESVTAEYRALCLKIAVAQFLNTAIVTLIVFAKLPHGAEFPGQEAIGLFDGEFDSFSSDWYSVVGVSITITMAVNALAPHAGPLAKALVVTPLTRRILARKMLTQIELNRLQQGPPFEIYERVSQTLTTLFVTCFYATGLPVLLPLACVNLVMTFWIDKFLILRVYRQPPMYDESLAELSWSLLPIALLMHIMVGAWMFTAEDIFRSDHFYLETLFDINATLVNAREFNLPTQESLTSEFNFQLLNATKKDDNLKVFPTILRWNVMPMVCLFFAVLVGFAVYHVAGSLIAAGVRKAIYVLSGGYINIIPTQQDRSYVPTYTGVFQRELDPRHEYELLPKEVEQGWVIEADDSGRQWMTKEWLDDGVEDGVRHVRGAKKRTWEVIRDAGLETYRITANPMYKDALATREAVVEKGEAAAAEERAKTAAEGLNVLQAAYEMAGEGDSDTDSLNSSDTDGKASTSEARFA